MGLPAARRGDPGNRAPAFIARRNDRGPAAFLGRPQGKPALVAMRPDIHLEQLLAERPHLIAEYKLQ